MTTTTIAPIVKDVTVPATPEAAFHRFTTEIGTWWPMSHSVGKENASGLTMEAGVGGRLYETGIDGTETEWGRVTVWEPNRRVAFPWHPGHESDMARLVEVGFEDTGDGTRVTLTHSGWEVLGERGQSVRDEYDGGWEQVLADYVGSLTS